MKNSEFLIIPEELKDKISRKVNRNIELEHGRVSYNRIHANKKAYKRKKLTKKDLVNMMD